MWQGSLDHLLAAACLNGSKGCAHGVGFIGIHEIDPLGSPGFEQVFHRQGGAREPFGVVNQNVILLNAQHHNIVIRAEQIRMIGIVGKIAHIQGTDQHRTMLDCRPQTRQRLPLVAAAFQLARPPKRLDRTRQSEIGVGSAEKEEISFFEVRVAEGHRGETFEKASLGQTQSVCSASQ